MVAHVCVEAFLLMLVGCVLLEQFIKLRASLVLHCQVFVQQCYVDLLLACFLVLCACGIVCVVWRMLNSYPAMVSDHSSMLRQRRTQGLDH